MISWKNHLLYLIDYQYWANETLMASLDKLSDEARKRDEGLPLKSIHGTLVQLLAVQAMWISRFKGEEPTPLDKAFFEEWRELKQALRLTMRQMQHDLQARNNQFFEDKLNYTSITGRPRASWVHDAIAHIASDFAIQRGMVVGVATRMGAPLPNLDYLLYRREMQESLSNLRASGNGESA